MWGSLRNMGNSFHCRSLGLSLGGSDPQLPGDALIQRLRDRLLSPSGTTWVWSGRWNEQKFLYEILEEERKTLKSTLDVDLNLSQHLMSTSQVNISCQHLMSIFQLDFPFLMPSISQYLEFNIYDCYFWVGFPVSAVKYFSKFGILHLRLHFWVGFPIFAVKYFSKLKFCIYDCTFGLDWRKREIQPKNSNRRY